MSFNNKLYKMIVASALVSGLTFVPIVYTFDVDCGLQMVSSIAYAEVREFTGLGEKTLNINNCMEDSEFAADYNDRYPSLEEDDEKRIFIMQCTIRFAMEHAEENLKNKVFDFIKSRNKYLTENEIFEIIDNNINWTMYNKSDELTQPFEDTYRCRYVIIINVDTDLLDRYINEHYPQANQNKPSVQSSNNIQELTATGEYRYGERESEAEAEEIARSKAMRRIIEQAGVFVESYTTVNNFKVTQDQINTAARAVIKIISDESTFDHQNHICRVTIKATVDTDSIGKYLNNH
ncbi:MAG: hypothetical protein IJ563_02290 [Selenomonadaceae bacterium]|nr:hypothetical protein [Selenomonadaceae bacterium]MBR1858299.1 hypothetical protein [Selenomonadaceae bacterium]